MSSIGMVMVMKRKDEDVGVMRCGLWALDMINWTFNEVEEHTNFALKWLLTVAESRTDLKFDNMTGWSGLTKSADWEGNRAREHEA